MEPFHLGLIGYPLGHSRSPAIHQAALRGVGLAGEYRLYPILPLPEGAVALQELLHRLRIGELSGLNVTIPHKQSVLPFLDELTPTAQAIGAVNTLLMRDGRLLGENTDAPGFLADLQRLVPETIPVLRKAGDVPASPPIALVLGAGGSARAVAYALLSAGFQVTIAARRVEEAQKIIHPYEDSSTVESGRALCPLSAIHINPASLARLITHPESLITLLVNTTPLGMHPNKKASPWPKGLPLPQGAVVYDLVYNPVETRLVQQARQAGLRAFTGLGMLVEQAALSFELWTGRPAPRERMYSAAAHPAAEQV
jgi:shikimate dehydrogenase